MDTTSKTDAPGTGKRRSTEDVFFSIWRDVSPVKRWSLVWPREHGAWGMLLVALITGTSVGFSSKSDFLSLLWLALASVAAFCLRTPIENVLPSSPFRPRNEAEWRWTTGAASVYSLCCAVAVTMLWRDGALRAIWEVGLAAGLLFTLQAAVKRTGKSNRLLAETFGVFGLALAAAAGYAVAAGELGESAIALWLLNGLFATNQILYVQYRIREARSSSNSSPFNPKLLLLGSEVITALGLIVSAKVGLLPPMVLVAFLPVFVRGGVWSVRTNHPPLRIHRLGKTELVHAILFGILLIAAFRVPPLLEIRFMNSIMAA